MNWFRENKFLGGFFIALGSGTICALALLWIAKARFDSTSDRFEQTTAELNRLQHLHPFPSETNLLALKTEAADFGGAIEKLKQELSTRVLPDRPLAPNEFQTELRSAVTRITAHAAANHVKLPDNFFLGFDEFATALPSNALAPLLGRQLAQIDLLLGILIDAHIDALTAFHRGPLTLEQSTAATTPITRRDRNSLTKEEKGKPLVTGSQIDLAFVSDPSAMRLCLNQIAAAKRQFFVIRTLHVLSEKDKGPGRGLAAPMSPVNSVNKSPTALNFIVGTEHVQTSAEIELPEFNF